MPEPPTIGIGQQPATPRQVFVDDSGRRRRWVRLAGVGVTVFCAGYIGIVAVGLAQTGVGPLEAVPAGGNGEIAGFDNNPGVPGILIGAAPPSTAQRAPAAAPPSRVRVRAAARTMTKAAASPKRSSSASPKPTTKRSTRAGDG